MRLISASAIAISTFCFAPEAGADEWTWEGEAAAVSDYRWRGVSLSDEQPSLQVEVTASHDSGAWLWGNVNTVDKDLGGAEIALGAGYTRTLGPIEWTLGAVHYFYPGEADIDYTEVDLTASASRGSLTVSAGFEYAPVQSNYDDDDLYSWVGFEVAAPHNITVHGHLGHDDGVMAPVPYAIDYSLGIGVPVGRFGVDLSLVHVESEDVAAVVKLSYAIAAD
jgi:uncharacterized protein (TIGR02001 family)